MLILRQFTVPYRPQRERILCQPDTVHVLFDDSWQSCLQNDAIWANRSTLDIREGKQKVSSKLTEPMRLYAASVKTLLWGVAPRVLDRKMLPSRSPVMWKLPFWTPKVWTHEVKVVGMGEGQSKLTSEQSCRSLLRFHAVITLFNLESDVGLGFVFFSISRTVNGPREVYMNRDRVQKQFRSKRLRQSWLTN